MAADSGIDDAPATTDPSQRKVTCLSFSGGGFRATLFHLGVLAYVSKCGYLARKTAPHKEGADSPPNDTACETSRSKAIEITDVYGISGGAIVAAHLGLHWEDYRNWSIDSQQRSIHERARDVIAFCRTDLRNRVLRRAICRISIPIVLFGMLALLWFQKWTPQLILIAPSYWPWVALTTISYLTYQLWRRYETSRSLSVNYDRLFRPSRPDDRRISIDRIAAEQRFNNLLSWVLWAESSSHSARLSDMVKGIHLLSSNLTDFSLTVFHSGQTSKPETSNESAAKDRSGNSTWGAGRRQYRLKPNEPSTGSNDADPLTWGTPPTIKLHNISISRAVACSSGYPLLFASQLIGNESHADGGIIDNQGAAYHDMRVASGYENECHDVFVSDAGTTHKHEKAPSQFIPLAELAWRNWRTSDILMYLVAHQHRRNSNTHLVELSAAGKYGDDETQRKREARAADIATDMMPLESVEIFTLIEAGASLAHREMCDIHIDEADERKRLDSCFSQLRSDACKWVWNELPGEADGVTAFVERKQEETEATVLLRLPTLTAFFGFFFRRPVLPPRELRKWQEWLPFPAMESVQVWCLLTAMGLWYLFTWQATWPGEPAWTNVLPEAMIQYPTWVKDPMDGCQQWFYPVGLDEVDRNKHPDQQIPLPKDINQRSSIDAYFFHRKPSAITGSAQPSAAFSFDSVTLLHIDKTHVAEDKGPKRFITLPDSCRAGIIEVQGFKNKSNRAETEQ